MSISKFRKFIETVNTYYAFAVLLYAVALFAFANKFISFLVLLALTPVLAAWGGYLFKGYYDKRTLRQGFHVISDKITYNVRDGMYILHYATQLKAAVDNLVTYPLAYQWTGSGRKQVPVLEEEGQQILGCVRQGEDLKGPVSVSPYIVTGDNEKDWHYWFVVFKRPLNKNDRVTVRYRQKFAVTKTPAKPYLYYVVRTKTDTLELNVKFSPSTLPRDVKASYVKATDFHREHEGSGLEFDKEKQIATWKITNPKIGYSYKIEWM